MIVFRFFLKGPAIPNVRYWRKAHIRIGDFPPRTMRGAQNAGQVSSSTGRGLLIADYIQRATP